MGDVRQVALATRRWLGVGRSAEPDARRAGSAATEAALEQGSAKLLVVFCSDAYDLEALLGAIRETAGPVPLVGCSTAGEIALGGPGDAGVVVLALGGEGFSVATAAAPRASERLRASGAEAASCIAEVDGEVDRPLSAEQADAWLGDPLHRPSGPGTLVGSDRLVAARPE